MLAVLCWAAKNSLRGKTVHSISLYEPILVKILNFIETVFHILNRNLSLGMEVLPPGSLDINPFDYLKCGVSRRGINRSFLKKNVPNHHHHGGLQQILMEATKKACSHFLSKLEKAVAAKGNFIFFNLHQQSSTRISPKVHNFS